MLRLNLPSSPGAPLNVLCLGAHADDIEIGCGGTVLRLIADFPDIHIRWIVFSAHHEREAEARSSAAAFLGSAKSEVVTCKFRDGYFPSENAQIKDRFEALKKEFQPSLILTHWLNDAHQDHRQISELTHNTFRNHLIWQYEIPKYDGDLGNPNLFVPLARTQLTRKSELILQHFASQRGRAWFTAETFGALARLRGIGCNAPEGVAEAFYATKLTV